MNDAVRAILDAVRPVLDPAPLVEALCGVEALPWRIAVVGRLGVGKSTLVNLLVGSRIRPTGLGGVSTDVVEVELPDGAVLVDTVGLDDEVEALDRLQPLLEEVDAVVWIVDGLQPMTATERRVLDASLIPGTPLHVRVSKLDLTDDHEPEAVLERVRRLAARHRPVTVQRLDLRGATEAPVDLLARTPSPRRVRRVQDALDALQAMLDALPPTETRADAIRRIRARWTEEVRHIERSVDERIADGTLENKVDALTHLHRLGDAVRARFVAELADDPVLGMPAPPDLPSPERPDSAWFRKVVASMSGIEGARRILRAGAARWLAEGEVVLLDWLEGLASLDAIDARHAAKVRAQDALSRARLAL